QAETTAGLGEILRACFPCASITGAPKASTMRLITALEDTPRGVYTGAIGYWAPGRRAQFNVAIRTAVVDGPRARLTYGVGSGIVWDSEAVDEYHECLLKARTLTEPVEPFGPLVDRACGDY
ncbi:MAG TPA: chorismate-binding protein, partial [Anaerolineales bacterium]|nr:chorismate-binding protein [Anaerolineales bacterium]